ncbi:MAG: sugar ABC transporter permease [Chthonomonadaceae bacterium]|nr:sugar ABC transporter permease [Chthonomonadaceae bacterium]
MSHLSIFVILPIAFSFWISLQDWNVMKGTIQYVGFSQYQSLATNAQFWGSVVNSLLYTALSVPLGMAVSIVVALLVSQPIKGANLFRTLYFIPSVCSTVAVSMMWIYIYLPQTGMINSLTKLFGLKDIDFLNDVSWALPALAFMSVWTNLGPRMIIYVAGLLSVPPAQYEAAQLDGAGAWTRFWKVSWPALAPTNAFVLLTGTIASLQLFTPVYMMTKGGPLYSTDVVGYHIFVEAWKKFHLSTASAQSFVLLAVVALCSWMQWKLFRKQAESYE